MGSSMDMGQGEGRRRGPRRRKSQPIAEINVTPLVDVMLVLLIIFMVAAPLLTVGVPIELPETKASQLQGEKEPLTISIDRGGRIFLQETEIAVDQIVPKLEAITRSGYKERIYVRGDARADYGVMMKVMGRISSAGFKRIALVTNAETGQ